MVNSTRLVAVVGAVVRFSMWCGEKRDPWIREHQGPGLGWNQSNLLSLEEKDWEKGTSWVKEMLLFATCQAQAAPFGRR